MYRYIRKGEYGYDVRHKPTDGFMKVSEEPNGEPVAYVAYKNGSVIQWLDGSMFFFETLDKAMKAAQALYTETFVPVYQAKD
jgi:hypothetical protein